MRYWTSDLHLGHKRVVDYCNRPFKMIGLDGNPVYLVNQMNETIQSTLLSILKPGDTLVVVGDTSLNPKYAHRLGQALTAHGVHLILVAGNHDSCFPWPNRLEHTANQLKKYFNAGWKEVYRLWNTTLSDGTDVLVSHLPYLSDAGNLYDDRYKDWKPTNEGKILLHGHLHGRYKKFGTMIDVGWDAHAGKILSEDDVITLIKSKEEIIDSPLSEWYKNRKGDRAS